MKFNLQIFGALIFLLFIFCCNQSPTLENNKNISNKAQNLYLPKQINLAFLPDSLKPKTIALDSMTKPLTVRIPKSFGGYYINTFEGGGNKIKLIPPTCKSPLLLNDERGKLILDSLGKPFILGDGGKSNFYNYNSDNGLVADEIFCSLEDKNGNLWFGSGYGVSCYDGKKFVNFTIAQGMVDNYVSCIHEDKSGNIWFGTSKGISKYDGEKFINFTINQGLTNNVVNAIIEDKYGNLWVGTDSGLCKYDGANFINFTTTQGLINNTVFSEFEDRNNYLWFGTDSGVCCYNGKKFVNYTQAQGLINNRIISIQGDTKGNLWFGTTDGVSCYNGNKFVNYNMSQGLANNFVNSILEDNNNNIWFCTNGGLSRYNGTTFASFTTEQGLANNKVFSINKDKNGHLWLCTGAGVSRYEGKAFVNFTSGQGIYNNYIYCMAEDKNGTLWFGTYGSGVIKYDGKTYINFTTNQGLASNRIYSIAEDKVGNLWFGTEGFGVCKYDGNSFTRYTTAQGLIGNDILCILSDKCGKIWFGNGSGVSCFDGKKFQNFTTAQGLAGNFVSSISEDKTGNIWFATNGGASIFNGKTFVNFTSHQGLLSNDIYCIKEDNNANIWFATSKGVSRYNRSTFESFTTSQGLADNMVFGIVQDKLGNIVIGSYLGFTLIPAKVKALPFSEIKQSLEYYTYPNSYPIKDIYSNAMICDSKGRVWAGSANNKIGLVQFDYSSIKKNIQPPKLVIQSIKVKDENICWYDIQKKGLLKNKSDSITSIFQEFLTFGKKLSRTEKDSIINRFGDIQLTGISKFYALPENLILPYHQNKISFEFTAIETARPFLIKYQYILEGYDNEWSPITSKTSASFGNIHEGTYTFKLKAQGENGVWTRPISYSFTVLPPWYRTWWAYASFIFSFLFLLWIFIKWREHKLRLEKENLEKTVEMRTAELVSEKKKSDDLLLNILPSEVAEELKAKGSAEAQLIDDVTVLFTDFKGFTQLSEKLSPKELIAEINECFSAFDHIMHKHGVEKIKTIGDAYMAAGGLPTANKTHASDVTKAALEIQQFMHDHKAKREATGKLFFEIRIGVHTGPVVAGIVGVKKFAYDIWGDTVNTASRMESSGEVGKVNISGSTYELVKDQFHCTYRGKITAKGKGEIDMYFVG